MIDQIRRELQARLNELVSEVDKLRRALVALGPGDTKPRTSARPDGSSGSGDRSAPAAPPKRARSLTAAAPRRAAKSTAATSRSAPGATKSAILDALETGEAMTASEIAAASGIGRATISTTLSRLAASGEIAKAARGYVLGSSGSSDGAGEPAAEPETADA